MNNKEHKNSCGIRKVELKLKNRITFFGIIIFFVCSGFISAQNRYIGFEKTSWNQVLEKAKKANKMIFLDCYTSWCGPCKWMDTNVYNNDTVADFYNSNFTCAKIDMEKDEGFELTKQYNITNYPTMLYLNAAGEEIHRTCGSVKSKKFIENGQDALDPEKQLHTFINRFNDGLTDAKTAFQYFSLTERAYQLEKSAITKYFLAQEDSNLTSFYNWKIIYRYADFTSKAFQYLETNKAVFSKLYGNDSVEIKINQIYANEMQQAHHKRDKIKYEELKAKFLKLKTTGAEKIIHRLALKLENLPNADLKNAVEITDSIIGPVNVSKGHGSIMDFQYWSSPFDHTLGRESNSAWFKLTINYDTILTFDIVPIDSLDDYDFAVFKGQSVNSQQKFPLNKNTLKPIRLCYSQSIYKSGITGLSKYATKSIVSFGPGPAYASAISVKAGETYYLYIDCFESSIKYNNNQLPLGFTIYFYNYWPKRKPIILNSISFENNKTVLSKEACSELDKLAVELEKTLTAIEIRGHADNKGKEQENLELSEERARAVVDYLKFKNISHDRIFYKGFGSTKPVASNKTEEGRSKNRRVEFVVIMN